MTDAFDLLVALRPEVPDEDGWATSMAGRAALARAHARASRPPWWRRRRYVVPTIFIGLGAAIGGGAVAFAPADRHPDAGVNIVCVSPTAEGDPGYTITTSAAGSPHAEIVAQCNAVYADEGKPAPVDYAECVVPPSRGQIGGAEVAVPSRITVTTTNNASICQAAEYEPAG